DHRELRLAMYCNDVVDFHRPIMIRKIKVKNLADHARTVKLMHHQDFNMFGTKVGDTAYYDPELKSIVHYRAKRYLSVTFFDSPENSGAVSNDSNGVSREAASGETWNPRIDEFACGTSGFHGAEGTWRDAEDGHLQGNAIAQGAVDTNIAHHVNVSAEGEKAVYRVIVAGESRDELIEQHKWITKMGPQGVIDRTTSYWRLWV